MISIKKNNNQFNRINRYIIFNINKNIMNVKAYFNKNTIKLRIKEDKIMKEYYLIISNNQFN